MGRSVTDVVAAALRGGATFIQLRAKHADTRDLTSMAEAIAADGVQIGQADMAPGQARALLGPDAIIGLSAETLPHIEAANAVPPSSTSSNRTACRRC